MLIANLLKPTVDYVFKRIFGYKGNEQITANLLSSILKQEIDDVELTGSPILEKDLLDDKVGILDIKAKINKNVTCDIEMQVVDQNNIEERILFYWGKLYTKTIISGENYKELEKCIVILFADFELDSLKGIPKYATKWNIREKDFVNYILTDRLEIYIIELPKISSFNENESLDSWVKFIKNPEVVDMSDANDNEAVKAAKKVLQDISNDEKERELAELREKYIMDQKAIASKGYDKGLEAGIQQGIEQERYNNAKKMLEEKIDIAIIIKITGLSVEEIEKIEIE